MADLFLVPYVRAVWRELGLRLGPRGRMALFGAGAHTRWLLDVTRDLPALPIVYILDDAPKGDTYLGLSVRRPTEIDITQFDLVLISSDQWEPRLAARVEELWGARVETVRLYQDLPPGPYDKSDDRAVALDKVKKLDIERPVTARQVVLISDLPRGREAKLGYALKSAGWRPVLLHGAAPDFQADRYFDGVRSYSGGHEALRLACEYSPLVYHVLVNTDYRTAETILQHRPGYIVVDSYDLVAQMYTPEFFAARPALTTQIARERYCLEAADGVCARSREYDYLARRCGYRYRRKVYFPDGCWSQGEAAKHVGEGIHVVYAGGLSLENAGGDEFAAHGYRLWLARALAEQGIHFHLYPVMVGDHRDLTTKYQEFMELGRNTGRVHVHDSVSVDQIAFELSRYDFGIFVYNHLSGLPGTRCPNPDAKLDNCTSNKFFDYLDAELPILHNAAAQSELNQMVERYGAGINLREVPVSAWGEVLKAADYERLRRGVARARQAYDVCRLAPALTAFYEDLRTPTSGSRWRDVLGEGDEEHAGRREEYRSALV